MNNDFLGVRARKLNIKTEIEKSKGVIICIPDKSSEKEIADKIKRKLKLYNNNISILVDPEPSVIKDACLPVILIGNLSNSKCAKDLYYKFLITTDCWYPGPCGYELRTLLDPLGNGENIIHIGYSENEGFKKGSEQFISKIDRSIIFLSEVKATRLHIPVNEEKCIRAIEIPKIDWQIINSNIYKTGYLGYLTGDTSLIKSYLTLWKAIIDFGIPKGNQKIKDLHLKMAALIQTFRLLETAGYIQDEKIRCDIVNYIMNWPKSDQGLITIEHDEYFNPKYPRQNHGLNPALALALLADYAKTYSYREEALEHWNETIEKVFYPYLSGSWKPICDGTCHGWYLSQPALLEYGLIDPKHRFFEEGGAKKAAEGAIALVENSGWMPGCGDYNLLRSFPGLSLKAAGAYYSDGRYKYINDLAPYYLSGKYHLYMPRMFDTGVKAIKPKDHIGIYVTPMDPIIYHAWDSAPNMVKRMLYTGPNAPLDKTFDKITIRTGFGENDQYLLLDGLGNNSNNTHSHPDALGIIDYYHRGESWLIALNGCQFPEPENNPILTIVRKGEEFKIPSFGELLKKEERADGSYYIATKLTDYSKTDWIREIFLFKDAGIVIIDTVRIKEDGNYSIQSHMRTPGRAELNDNEVYNSRKSENGDLKEFYLSYFCSENSSANLNHISLEKAIRNHKGEKMPLVKEEDNVIAWQNRYHTKDRIISSLDVSVQSKYKKGDRISFIHTAYVKDETKLELLQNDNKLKAIMKDKEWFIESPYANIADNILMVKSNEKISNDYPLLKENTIDIFECGEEPSLIKELSNGSIAMSFSNGRLVIIEKNGSIIADKILIESIYSITCLGVGKEIRYYTGHGQRAISCFDHKLDLIWQKNIIREATSCHWWELDYPSVIALESFVYNGKDHIIAGCGDILVRCFNNDGDIDWTFHYINGVPGRINIWDIDGDGIPEILVGGEIISNRSTCRILTPGGILKYELGVEMWTSRLTAISYNENSTEKYIALGSNWGRNLHLYKLIIGEDSLPEKMFEKKLGGYITDTIVDVKNQQVIASSKQGYVAAYNFKGENIWVSSFLKDIKHMIYAKGSIIVLDGDGCIFKLSMFGEIIGKKELKDKKSILIKDKSIIELDKVLLYSNNKISYIEI